MTTPNIALQDELLNVEPLLSSLRHGGLNESFEAFLRLWSSAVDRLDMPGVRLHHWAEHHWLPVLNQLAQYYSQLCRLEYEQMQAISALRKEVEALLYDRLNQLSLEQGWFELEVIYPYETQLHYGRSDFEVMGRRPVSANYIGCVVEILCLGCSFCSEIMGPHFEPKARVIVGGR